MGTAHYRQAKLEAQEWGQTMKPAEVTCPVCRAQPYQRCTDYMGGPMHMPHEARRRKGYAVARSMAKRRAT